MDKKLSAHMNIATMLAAAMGSLSYIPSFSQRREPKQRKPAPTMVTSPRKEIAAWNAQKRSRYTTTKQRALIATFGSVRQLKIARRLERFPGYAAKHPTIAARYPLRVLKTV